MSKYVDRSTIKDDLFRIVLDKETHHDHKIVDDRGILKWVRNPEVGNFVDNVASLNELIPLFISMGFDKNSEPYRKLYRDIGYSLWGYWEIFYWEANNENADEYNPYA